MSHIKLLHSTTGLSTENYAYRTGENRYERWSVKSLSAAISKLTLFIANTSYNCSNVQFDITEQGEIDKGLLFENNPCLGQIAGVQYLQ